MTSGIWRASKAWLLDKLRSHGEAIVYRAAGLPLALRPTARRCGSPADTIRAAYRGHYRRPEKASEWLDIVAALVIMLPGILYVGLRGTLKNGRIIASRSGKSPLRQFGEQLGFTLRHGILPPWYYVFELHQPEQACQAASFLGRAETKEGAYRILAHHRGSTSPLGDKLAFAAHCLEHGLPAVQPLAVARAGRLVVLAGEVPSTDLFAKPVRASGGSGAWRLDRCADGMLCTSKGERLTLVEALQRFADSSGMRPMMLQPRLSNHPALVDIVNGALSTVRLLTCLDEREEPELVGAAFRMAIGSNHVVDNLHAGGLASAVDLATGVLAAATDLGTDARLGRVDRHPTSGAAICGRPLPYWPEVCALGIRAHRAFADYALIGWDIAILKDGPILVEGNSGPDLDIIQRVDRRPLGNARLATLLAHHLVAAEKTAPVPQPTAALPA